MPPSKRPRAVSVSSSEVEWASDGSIEMVDLSDDDEMDMDISSALAGKRRKVQAFSQDDIDLEDDEDLAKFLKDSIAKRDVKGGTQVLKKAKGKGKVAKGEVGGGSFQSMGASSVGCFAISS